MDPHALAVVIRLLHVAAMAVAAGGAVLVAALGVQRAAAITDGALLDVAARYERAFWAAAGVLVMTGVGNLAAFGEQLPSRDTAWGAALLAKLAIVVALMVLSVPRTLAVAQLSAAGPPDRGRSVRALVGRMYVATIVALGAILAIAVWLSHG